jgi:hypothetical protein
MPKRRVLSRYTVTVGRYHLGEWHIGHTISVMDWSDHGARRQARTYLRTLKVKVKKGRPI